ncbi:hypothetical protein EDD16DRAFT_1708643 [Pisolithus croceorrhizus]|nr:hypothetical protein EDD16DRAFT_1708643 [Pisolithus croceorrhizus]
MHHSTKVVNMAGDGGTISYDVFISTEPAPKGICSSYDGDVHVWLSDTPAQHTISIFIQPRWIVWNPSSALRVRLADAFVYPTPCKSTGMKYVGSETEFLRESKGVPKDAITLAYLIAIDAGVKGTGGSTDYLWNQANASRQCSSDLGGSKSIPSVSRSNTALDKGKGREIEFGMAGIKPHVTMEEGDVSMEHDHENLRGKSVYLFDYCHLLAHLRLSSDPAASTLDWSAHGIATVTSWTCKKDAVAMAFMASSWKVSEVNHHYQMLVELGSHGKPLRELHRDIRQALAQGTAVLVHGWRPQQAMEFSLEDIREYRPLLSQMIKWQDASEWVKLFKMPPSARSYVNQIVEGSLHQFMLALVDQKSCWNCLDLPSLIPEIPPFLRGILDDRMAMMTTRTEAYVTAKGEATKGDCSGLNGLQLMHFDAWRSCAWDIMTHGGFLTYPHHDATGFLTYSYIQTGAKLWAYIHLDDVDEFDSDDVAAKWNAYYKHPMATETYNKNVVVGTVLLEKGAVLIQPPGVNHMVYTPVPTVMSGHFLTYETMHLTEMALTLDFGLGKEDIQHATNALHPGTLRKVYRMAIALPKLVLEQPLFHERCIIALGSIVSTDPLSFGVDEYEEGVHLKAKDALSAELAGECAQALDIMGGVMRKWNVANPWKEMRKGLWRDPGPLKDISFLGFL